MRSLDFPRALPRCQNLAESLPASPLPSAPRSQNRSKKPRIAPKLIYCLCLPVAWQSKGNQVPESRSLRFAFSVHSPAWHFPSNNCAFCLSIIHPCHRIPVVHLYLWASYLPYRDHSALGLVSFMIHGYIVPKILQRRSWSNLKKKKSKGKKRKENRYFRWHTVWKKSLID